MKIYLVGSLKHPGFVDTAEALRAAGHDVFDDWRGGGPDGDARWRDYELNERDRGYAKAVFSHFAENNREFDRSNLVAQEVIVAVCKPNKLPGPSSVAELSYAKHHGIPAYVLLNGEPHEWELMLPLAVTDIFENLDQLLEAL
jgi:hypothetical protein